MMRVPGTSKDLLTAKAEGADVRPVYSPIDAVQIAIDNPDKEIVFFSVGFETTAPANALAVLTAQKKGLKNFSLLTSQVTVPAAMHFLLSSKANKIEGFLAAGHVCTVMGYNEYEDIPEKYKTPVVITGFEPVDLLYGILKCVQQLEKGAYTLENAYERMVTREGNVHAKNDLYTVFQPCDQEWRGIGFIPQSGLCMRPAFDAFNADKKFSLYGIKSVQTKNVCIAGDIMTGQKTPCDCPVFGTLCVPEKPIGAPMVSSEGACAAYYKYKKIKRA
jgi:hydrogenase expression/formation protein HypD